MPEDYTYLLKNKPKAEPAPVKQPEGEDYSFLLKKKPTSESPTLPSDGNGGTSSSEVPVVGLDSVENSPKQTGEDFGQNKTVIGDPLEYLNNATGNKPVDQPDLINQISNMPGGLEWGKQQGQLPAPERQKLIPPKPKLAKLNQPIAPPETPEAIAESEAKNGAAELGKSAFENATNGKFPIANAELTLAEKQDPTNYYYNQLKASNLAHQGDDQNAMLEVSKAITKNPQSLDLHADRMLYAHRAGNKDIATGDAQLYLDRTTKDNGETVAKHRAEAYAILGNEKEAQNSLAQYRALFQDRVADPTKPTMTGFSDMFLSTFPLTVGFGMMDAGTKAIGEGLGGKRWVPEGGLLGSFKPTSQDGSVGDVSVSKIASGVMDVAFGAMSGAVPTLAEFNLAADMTGKVLPEDLNRLVFQPISTMLMDENYPGYSEFQKLGYKISDLATMGLYFKGKDILAKKVFNKEPLSAIESHEVAQAVNELKPSDILQAAKINGKFEEKTQNTKAVQGVQDQHTDIPSYSIYDTPYSEPKAIIADLTKAKEAGAVEPVYHVVGDPATENKATELFKPEVKTEERPAKDITTMSADELRNYSKEVKTQDSNMEVEFFGEDGAKEYRNALKASDSDFTTPEKRNEAYATIDKYEKSLTPEQHDRMFGGNMPDHAELLDISRKVGFVEQSENLNELSSSIKNAALKMYSKNPSKETLTVLNAANKKAAELGIAPDVLIKDVIKKVGSDFKDPSDAAFMMGSVLKSLIKEPVSKESLPAEKPKEPQSTPIIPEGITPKGIKEKPKVKVSYFKQNGKDMVRVSSDQSNDVMVVPGGKAAGDGFYTKIFNSRKPQVEIGMKEITDIVKKSGSVDDARQQIKMFKNIKPEVAKEFKDKYDPEGKLTPEQAFEKFYNEVKTEQQDAKIAEEKQASKDQYEKTGLTKPMREGGKGMSEEEKTKIIDTFATKLTDETVKQDIAYGKEQGKEATPEKINKYREDVLQRNKVQFGKLIENIDNKNYKELSDRLHLGNKTSRKLFETYTGVNLGKTVKETLATLKDFTGYKEPEKPVITKLSKEESLSKAQKAKDENTLNKKFRYSDGEIRTRKQQVDKVISEGGRVETKEVDKIKEPSRTQYNRMDSREQDAYEKRKREAGKKTEYRLVYSDGKSFSEITKAEYDYANETLNKKGENDVTNEKSKNAEVPVGEQAGSSAGNGGQNAKGKETANEGKTPKEEIQVPKVKAKFQALADKARSNKIQKGLDEPTSMGINDKDLWNDAWEEVAKILETTGDFAQALTDGIAKLKSKDDKDRFKERLAEMQKNNVTGIRHKDTATIREEYGLPAYERNNAPTEEVRAEARKMIDDGYDVGELMKRIEDKGGVSGVEQAIMGEYVLGLREITSKNTSDANLTKLQKALHANELAGSIESEAFRMRQEIFQPEADVASTLIEFMDAAQADKLTAKQKAYNEKYYSDLSKEKADLEAEVAKLSGENLDLRAKQNLDRIAKESKPKLRLERLKEKTARLEKEKQALLDELFAEHDNVINKMGYGFTIAEEKLILKLTKNFIDRKITDVDKIATEIYDALKDKFAGIAKDDIKQIMAGETTNKDLPTKNMLMEIKKDLESSRKALGEQKKNAAKSDATEGQRTSKNRADKKISEKVKYTKEEKEAVAEQKKIDALQEKLDNLEKGILADPKTKSRESSQEIKDLRKQIKEHELTRLNLKEKSLDREIAKVENQLKTGKFRQPDPPPLKPNKAVQAKMDKLLDLREQRKQELMRQKFNARTLPQRLTDITIGLSSIPRNVIASMDLSMALMQQGFVAISHPMVWTRSLKGALGDMVDSKKFDRWMAQVKTDRRYGLATKSGLAITDPKSTELNMREEFAYGSPAERIPFFGAPLKIRGKGYGGLLQASSRVYSSMQNRTRIERMFSFIDTFEADGKTMENSPKLYKMTADYVNVTTGRGSLFGLEQSAKYVASVLFAPHLYSGQFQLLTGRHLFVAPKEVKMMYIKDMTKYVAAAVGFLALAKLGGLETETDTRSKNYGRVKIAGMWVGLPGNFIPYIVLLSQLIRGEEKSMATGEIKPMGTDFGQKSRGDVVLRWVRGKFSPPMAVGADIMTGQTYMGEETTLPVELRHNFVPISIGSGIDEARYNNALSGILNGAVSATGLSTTTIPPTGWYPKQTIEYKGQDINALGENPDKFIDKPLWTKLAKYKVNLEPQARFKVKIYDPKTQKDEKMSKEQYADWVKLRGDYILQDAKETFSELDDPKKRELYIKEIMTVENADGTKANPDRKTAEWVLENVIVQSTIQQNILQAGQDAKDEIQTGFKPDAQTKKILDGIKQYKKMYGEAPKE